MGDPNLFDWKPPEPEAKARRTDPETSHAAARSVTADKLARLQAAVIRVLKEWPSGLTVPEIAVLLGEPRDTISPRIRPMVNLNLVADSGEKRIPPGHTRSCIVWRAG